MHGTKTTSLNKRKKTEKLGKDKMSSDKSQAYTNTIILLYPLPMSSPNHSSITFYYEGTRTRIDVKIKVNHQPINLQRLPRPDSNDLTMLSGVPPASSEMGRAGIKQRQHQTATPHLVGRTKMLSTELYQNNSKVGEVAKDRLAPSTQYHFKDNRKELYILQKIITNLTFRCGHIVHL